MAEEVTTTTTTESEIERNQYRFGALRYSLQGPYRWLADQLVLEEPGLMTYPKADTEED